MQIGLSLCLGANLRSGGASFSPASLFADGDGALIQRRSDAFFVENTASTHAVDTNAVGFATDASEGAGYSGGEFTGLGAEIMPAGSDQAANWTLVSSMAALDQNGGKIRATASGTNARARLALSATAGSTYVYSATYDLISGLDRQLRAFISNNSGTADQALNELGPARSFSNAFQSTTSAPYTWIWLSGSDADQVVDYYNASIRELPGHHATQATTSYKPTLQTGGLLFDGNDDRLTGLPAPTTSGTLAARFNGTAASKVILGSQAASDGRCFLALDASGAISAGIGAQGTSTITGGSDIRSGWHTAAVTWDGSTVTLYLDGVSVYSAAQSGAVNTTVAMMLGALNANGSGAAFWAGTVSDALAIDRVLTPDEITNLNDYWSA